MRLKGKLYKSVVRHVVLFGMLGGRQKLEQRKSVMEIRILRWMSNVMREDRIRNEYIKYNIKLCFDNVQNER